MDIGSVIQSMPINTIWFDIGVIIIAAAFFALIARLLKQPSIPAYIIGGVIIGPVGLGIIKNTEVITVLSEIGIAFLLFFAGLEISFRKLKDVAGVSAVAGLAQIVTVSFISCLIALAFSFSKSEIVFIALAISFSSTAIVVKLLADKNELNTLHARIAIGMLLFQDIISIIALTALSTKTLSAEAMILPVIKVFVLILLALIISKTMLRPMLVFAAYSVELLFLSAIAVCFFFSLLAALPFFGLPSISIVIGSFIAGILLANSPFKIEIESKMISLRDFFITIFFVSIGMQLVFSEFLKYALPFVCLVFIVIFIEPYVSMVFVRLFGYTEKTSFFTGFFQAQTSEFSIILMAQGLALGHVSQSTFSMIVLITVVTMSLTPFLISNERFFFEKLSKALKIFRMISIRENTEYNIEGKKDIVLFGCHRMGSVFLKSFSKVKDRIIVVDVNPSITKELINQKVPNIYGDMADPDVLKKINLKEINLAISTVPDKIDNIFIIKKVKKENQKAIVFVTADFISDALELYDAGADYVMLPQIMAGEHCLSFLHGLAAQKESLEKARKEHIEHLKKIGCSTYDVEY